MNDVKSSVLTPYVAFMVSFSAICELKEKYRQHRPIVLSLESPQLSPSNFDSGEIVLTRRTMAVAAAPDAAWLVDSQRKSSVPHRWRGCFSCSNPFSFSPLFVWI